MSSGITSPVDVASQDDKSVVSVGGVIDAGNEQLAHNVLGADTFCETISDCDIKPSIFEMPFVDQLISTATANNHAEDFYHVDIKPSIFEMSGVETSDVDHLFSIGSPSDSKGIGNSSAVRDFQVFVDKKVESPDCVKKVQLTDPAAGGGNFGCEFCEKIFRFVSQLKQHRQIHKKEKPFQCNQCEKRFSQPGNLNVHIKTIHKGGPQPFYCTLCNKKCKSLDSLRNHMKMHNPAQCDLCDKRAQLMGNPKEKCEFCTKRMKKSLERYQRVTANIRKQIFQCDLCKKEFPRASSLEKHLIDHH